MLVPFGTRVVDKNGKGVGTVSRVVLHSGSRQASGLVVHQGVLDRRQIVVPIAKVASFGDEVRLTLSASDLAGLDLYNAESLQLMPDQWEMPAGFDQREFFLVGGDGWTEAVLPFERTSAAVSGTPAVMKDSDTPAEPREPVIAARGRGLRQGGAEGRRGRRRGAGSGLGPHRADHRPAGHPLPRGDGDSREPDRQGRRAHHPQRDAPTR